MKTRIRIIPVLLLAAFIALAMPHKAEAVNLLGWTDSGTNIISKATINFNVGAVPQTLIESAPLGNTTPGLGNGLDTTFVVDNRVLVTVVAIDGATVTTYPGSSAQALEFTVTNSGNTPQDYALATGLDVDNMFAATVSVDIYEDTNSDGVYSAGDTLTTTLDEMAIDEIRTVFVVSNAVPLTAVNGDWANYYLRAVTHDAGGAGLGALTTESGAPDVPGTVDNVFDDIDGDAGAIDGPHDGAEMAWGANNVPAGAGGPGGFVVAGALLTVTKTSAVISDPINLLVNPKAIPGATVEYTITIANAAGAATATSVAIADTIDANTTAQTAAFGAGMGLTINFNGGGAVAHTSAADGPEAPAGYTASFVGGVISAGQISVAATQDVVIKYRVTIN